MPNLAGLDLKAGLHPDLAPSLMKKGFDFNDSSAPGTDNGYLLALKHQMYRMASAHFLNRW